MKYNNIISYPEVVDHFASTEEVTSVRVSKDTLSEAARCLECNKPYYRFLDYKNDNMLKWSDAITSKFDNALVLSYCGISIMVHCSIPFHADNCTPKDNIPLGEPDFNLSNYGFSPLPDTIYVPNHCPDRCLSAVVYLNTIDSGATVFPNYNVVVSPTLGRLLLFGCDHRFVHGVFNVGANIRTAALLWFKRNR